DLGRPVIRRARRLGHVDGIAAVDAHADVHHEEHADREEQATRGTDRGGAWPGRPRRGGGVRHMRPSKGSGHATWARRAGGWAGRRGADGGGGPGGGGGGAIGGGGGGVAAPGGGTAGGGGRYPGPAGGGSPYR